MINEQLWLLLSLKLSGEATKDELEALDKMLHENPQWVFHAEVFSQLWKGRKTGTVNTDESFNRHLQRLSISPQYEEKPSLTDGDEVNDGTFSVPSKWRRLWWPLVAASVVLLGFLLFREDGRGVSKEDKQKTAQNTVITKKGSKSNIQLPDGTTVWLNSDTKIKYDEMFRNELREVELEGEAFFDVVRDPQRPFIIHTRTVDIKVLGTAFNVRAYANEKSTETSLIRGEVEVTLLKNPEKKIVLKPNEKLLVNNNEELAEVLNNEKMAAASTKDVSITVGKVHFEKKDSTALEAMWTKNKLVFDAETLEEVAQKIERWYDVRVVVDERVKQTEYSAIFDNETLAQVMEALKFTGNFDYTISKNQVNIR